MGFISGLLIMLCFVIFIVIGRLLSQRWYYGKKNTPQDSPQSPEYCPYCGYSNNSDIVGPRAYIECYQCKRVYGDTAYMTSEQWDKKIEIDYDCMRATTLFQNTSIKEKVLEAVGNGGSHILFNEHGVILHYSYKGINRIGEFDKEIVRTEAGRMKLAMLCMQACKEKYENGLDIWLMDKPGIGYDWIR